VIPPPFPVRSPRTLGLDPTRLEAAATLVEEAVLKKGVPGAVLLVTRRGGIALHRAWGAAGLRPESRPMQLDTLFDMASVTKPVVVGSALAILLEEKRVGLDDPVAKYLPAFGRVTEERAKVTLRHLATHCAGIPAGGAYAKRMVTLEEIVEEIARSRRMAAPGEKFIYSDYSAITLGAVVETVTKTRLDHFCQERVFRPLGMVDTGYRPGVRLAPRCASTAAGADTPGSRGRVHDPTAAALEGAGCVSGNAGLFSTAEDLARLAQLWIRGGEYGGLRLLQPETVRFVTQRQSPVEGKDGERGVLWDIGTGYAVRGELAIGSYGHTGFTGTSLWIDPINDCSVILLTNAVHAVDAAPKTLVIGLRRLVATIVANAFVK